MSSERLLWRVRGSQRQPPAMGGIRAFADTPSNEVAPIPDPPNLYPRRGTSHGRSLDDVFAARRLLSVAPSYRNLIRLWPHSAHIGKHPSGRRLRLDEANRARGCKSTVCPPDKDVTGSAIYRC